MKEELEAEITALEDQIKARMGNEETLLAGAFKVSWTTYTASRFDSTRFRKDHAELAAAYRFSYSFRSCWVKVGY